jgi:hypothetical protein
MGVSLDKVELFNQDFATLGVPKNKIEGVRAIYPLTDGGSVRPSPTSLAPCISLPTLAGLLCALLGGCSLSSTVGPTPDAGLALQGRVFGGQEPIVGANVYLYAANTTGYGGAGIAASTNNASISLLTSAPGSTTQDSSGDYYVTTDNTGTFTITGDYTCTPNAQVYLYTLGGSQGGVANSIAQLLAVLGNCPSSCSFATETPYVVVNEVTTVAAAYALAGFMTNATHVSSSGTALALTGIANAFANAANLADISTGTALATTPAGNGTVPQAEINTLANILAACVNSNGVVSGPTNATACYTLFANLTGLYAGRTANAAMDIAQNPGTNVAALYALSMANPPFAPALSAQPNDLTIAISFTGGGLSAPQRIAIDQIGDVWVTNAFTNIISEFGPLGAAVSGSPIIGGGLGAPSGIAIDSSGNVWVTNTASGTNSLSKFNSSGMPVSGSPFTGGGLNGPDGPAIDAMGNVWVANATYGVDDGSGDVWVTVPSYSTLVELVGAATPVITPIVANLLPPYGSHAVNMP